MEMTLYLALIVVVWIVLSEQLERDMRKRMEATRSDLRLVEDFHARPVLRPRSHRLLHHNARVRGRVRGPGEPQRGNGGRVVNAEHWIVLILAAAVAAYLLYALLRPERF